MIPRTAAEAESPAVVSDHVKLQQVYADLHRIEAEVDGYYARWAELTEKAS